LGCDNWPVVVGGDRRPPRTEINFGEQPVPDTNAPGVRIYRSIADAIAVNLPVRNGKQVQEQAVYRWIMNGVKLRSGGILRLKARRYPGYWAINDDDFQAFLDALTADRARRFRSAAVEEES
jgi:hypothetical protein